MRGRKQSPCLPAVHFVRVRSALLHQAHEGMHPPGLLNGKLQHGTGHITLFGIDLLFPFPWAGVVSQKFRT